MKEKYLFFFLPGLTILSTKRCRTCLVVSYSVSHSLFVSASLPMSTW